MKRCTMARMAKQMVKTAVQIQERKIKPLTFWDEGLLLEEYLDHGGSILKNPLQTPSSNSKQVSRKAELWNWAST